MNKIHRITKYVLKIHKEQTTQMIQTKITGCLEYIAWIDKDTKYTVDI